MTHLNIELNNSFYNERRIVSYSNNIKLSKNTNSRGFAFRFSNIKILMLYNYIKQMLHLNYIYLSMFRKQPNSKKYLM